MNDQTIRDMDEIINLDPENALAYTIRGSVYCQKGNYDLAIADLDKAIRLDSEDAVAYTRQGNRPWKQRQL